MREGGRAYCRSTLCPPRSPLHASILIVAAALYTTLASSSPLCVSGMAMGSTESRKVCWNSKCGTSSSTIWRPGWITRSGRTAELCDYCGFVCYCLSNSVVAAGASSSCLLMKSSVLLVFEFAEQHFVSGRMSNGAGPCML